MVFDYQMRAYSSDRRYIFIRPPGMQSPGIMRRPVNRAFGVAYYEIFYPVLIVKIDNGAGLGMRLWGFVIQL
jgi:hypothetical protein